MSRIIDTIKNKNRVKVLRDRKNKEEVRSMRDWNLFKARLGEESKALELLLSVDGVESIKINIADKYLMKFNTAIHSEELVGYVIRQSEGKMNEFDVRKKYVEF